jgi:hypothetical protein
MYNSGWSALLLFFFFYFYVKHLEIQVSTDWWGRKNYNIVPKRGKSECVI